MIPQAYPLYVVPEGIEFHIGNTLLVVGWEKTPDGYSPVVIHNDANITAPASRLDGGFRFAGLRVGNTR